MALKRVALEIGMGTDIRGADYTKAAVRALRDLVQVCRAEHIAAVFVVPPEGSAFRNYAPAVEAAQVDAIRELAHELAVPLIDARTWVDDANFFDGHHATPRGAAVAGATADTASSAAPTRSVTATATSATTRTLRTRRRAPAP